MHSPFDKSHSGGDAPGRGRGAPAHTYSNPVLDEDFPDPAVIRADDGFYYA
jgi:arabinan endo-1,5-alpha-L-arabinosidase